MLGIYGFVQFSSSIVEVFLRLYLVVYFTTIVGLKGEQAGLIVSSSLVVSAFFAPAIGNFADYFKRRFGNVKPLINLAIVCLSVSLILLFVPKWESSQKWTLFILCFFYQISYTSFLIPYFSLAKELVIKSNDIISLHSWRYFWGSLGAIIGVSLPYLGKYFNDNTYLPFGLLMAAGCLIFGPTALHFIKDISNSNPIHTETKKGFKKDIKQLLKTKPFKYFLFFYILMSIGLGINQTLAVFYYKESLMLTSTETSQLLGVYMLFFCLSILVWTIISKKIGLKKTILIGVTGTLCVF